MISVPLIHHYFTSEFPLMVSKTCLRESESSWNIFISQKHFVITKPPNWLCVVDCVLNLPELKIAFSNLHDFLEVTNETKLGLCSNSSEGCLY